MATCAARLRGGRPWVDLDQLLAIPQALVPQVPFDHTPRDIADGLGKVVVLNHAFDIERFNGDQIKTADKIGGQLVAPIQTHISNASMETSHLQSLLSSVVRARLFARKLFLFLLQTIKSRAVVPGVVVLLPLAGNHCVGEPQVQTNAPARLRQGGDVELDREADKVSPGRVLRNRYRRWVCAIGQGAAPTNTKGFGLFGQVDTRSPDHATGHETERRFRKLGRLLVVLTLETGMFGSLLEEVGVGCREVPERLLKGYARDVAQPCVLGLSFPLCQQGTCGSIVRAWTRTC